MSTKMLLFWLSTTVIFLALVFVSGTYFYLYFRDKKMVRLATSSIKGTVVGYNSFRGGNPPIVEYKVNGVAYKKSFRYFFIRTVSTPWGPKQASYFLTREEMLANSITFYRNSFVSFNTALQTQFPLCSSMTVWYDPEKPSRAYVERYCGVNRYYKWAGILYGILLLLVYAVVLVAFSKKWERISKS